MLKTLYTQTLASIYSDSIGVLKYQKLDYLTSYGYQFNNVIYEKENFHEKYIEWEGEINLPPLMKGERLNVLDKVYKIEEVVKDIDGTYTYNVGKKVSRCDNYEELFNDCLESYNASKIYNYEIIIEDGYGYKEESKKHKWFEKILKWNRDK